MYGLPVEENIANARVERLVFGHLLIGHEVDRLKAMAPRLTLSEFEQLPSNASALSRWVDGYAVKEKTFVGHE